MRSKFRPWAIAFGVLATLITTVIRVWLTPGSQDVSTGQFYVNYIIIGAFVVSLAVIGILVLSGTGALAGMETLTKRQRLPMAVSGLLLGSVMVIVSLLDGWLWMTYGLTPPPNERVISGLDSLSLQWTLIFGVLAGLFFVWLGFVLLGGTVKPSVALSVGALAPVAWIWVRLVRFEVSYASATQVQQSFYDVLMLIFTMLFLFSFARYVSRVGQRSPRMTLLYALGALLFSASGYLSQAALYTVGETAAYNASKMAGITDLFVGIFALCAAWTMVYGRTTGDEPPAPLPETAGDGLPEPDAAPAPSAEGAVPAAEPADSDPTVEDILRGLNKGGLADPPAAPRE